MLFLNLDPHFVVSQLAARWVLASSCAPFSEQMIVIIIFIVLIFFEVRSWPGKPKLTCSTPSAMSWASFIITLKFLHIWEQLSANDDCDTFILSLKLRTTSATRVARLISCKNDQILSVITCLWNMTIKINLSNKGRQRGCLPSGSLVQPWHRPTVNRVNVECPPC